MSPTLECPVPMHEIEALLRKLGASGRYVGLQYATLAIALILDNPERIHFIVKGIYSPVASALGVSMSSVERSLRTLFANLWYHHDHAVLDQVLGYHPIDRPTNSEFLDALAHYLLHHS